MTQGNGSIPLIPNALANPYFTLGMPQPITSVEELLSLNVERQYFAPGDTAQSTHPLSQQSPHSTPGLFRGQLSNWPLVPQCFRDIVYSEADDLPDFLLSVRWREALHPFTKFCERAEMQNPSFPSGAAERMSIAQHFGIPTPLLDWSQSIFTAVFFAVRHVFSDPLFELSFKVYVYHIADERLLVSGVPSDGRLEEYRRSGFVKPYHIDRRIERQRGVFTFHPHPAVRPEQVPVRVYTLEFGLISSLLDLMKGFGFTEDYYFPDYAGIAKAVMSDTSL